MFYGSLFSILTGFVWLAIAIDIMVARRAKCRVEHFYVLSSLGSSLILALFLLHNGTLVPAEWSWITIACMVAGSLTNALANICSMINLGYGGAALYFAIGRTGFALSFIWSVIFLKDTMTPVNLLGLLCLVAAVFLSALVHPADAASTRGNYSSKCLLLALLGVFAAATTQVLFIYPGSRLCNAPPLPAMNKTLLIMLSNIVIFSIMAACRKQTEKPRRPILVGTSLAWSVLAICSYAALFTALRHAGEAGHTGIVYPIGNAVQILGMTVFTRIAYKEKMTRFQIAAILLILIGIFAIKL